MQVAKGNGSMVASHVCTVVNALVGTKYTPPAQVADGAHCKCSEVFALIGGRKNTTSTLVLTGSTGVPQTP